MSTTNTWSGRATPRELASARAAIERRSRSSLPETMDLSDEALEPPSPDEHQYRSALLRLAASLEAWFLNDNEPTFRRLQSTYDSLVESGLLEEPDDPSL